MEKNRKKEEADEKEKLYIKLTGENNLSVKESNNNFRRSVCALLCALFIFCYTLFFYLSI